MTGRTEKILKKLYYSLKRFDKSALRISPNNQKFCFIHINKTAGTSIAKFLNYPYIMHNTVQELCNQYGDEEIRNAFLFTFVRNPYDRVRSQFKHYVLTNQFDLSDGAIGFNEWVIETYGSKINPFYNHGDKYFSTQMSWLSDKNGSNPIDYIGKFENLNNDFRSVCQHLGYTGNLKRSNHSDTVNIEGFSAQSKEIIYNYFEEDFINLDYKK